MLKAISIENFRNLQKTRLDFSETVNIIVGDNGQGKTNLLEAIYLLSHGKSFRASKTQIIYWRADWAQIVGFTESDRIEIRLYRNQDNQAFINSKKKGLISLLGRFVSAIFYPEEIGMINGSPNGRRAWLDRLGSVINESYLHDLVSHQKALANKNKILKSPRPDQDQIDIWNKNLVKVGIRIWRERLQIIDEINRVLSARSNKLVGHKIFLEYTNPLSVKKEPFTEEAYFKKLNSQRDLERRSRATLFGPHRDDFKIIKEEPDGNTILQKNLGSFGSRAEQRQAVILLGLAEAKVFTDYFGQAPVLILDDAGSELDKGNKELLFEHLPARQVFISTTSLDLLPKSLVVKARVFTVKKGIIKGYDSRSRS